VIGRRHRTPRHVPAHAAPRERPAHRAARSGRLRALLSLGLVVGFGAISTLAYWSDDDTVSVGAFTAGVLDMRLNGQDTLNLTSTFTLSAMVPGESIAASLTVQNTGPGNVPFTYTATGLGSGTLAPYVTYEAFLNGTSSNGTSGGLRTGSCTGTSTGAAQALNTSKTLIATPQSLAVGATQNVCVIAKLSTSTPTGQQGTTTSATLTFTATQLGAP
jgi:predicted ribosomally synthesized peptide with SipW-like signal peptide